MFGVAAGRRNTEHVSMDYRAPSPGYDRPGRSAGGADLLRVSDVLPPASFHSFQIVVLQVIRTRIILAFPFNVA